MISFVVFGVSAGASHFFAQEIVAWAGASRRSAAITGTSSSLAFAESYPMLVQVVVLVRETAVQMNIAEAKAKLSELVAAAERGEEVIIARGGQPAVRLVSVHRPTVRIGIGDGLVSRVPDFIAPMSEDELKDWE